MPSLNDYCKENGLSLDECKQSTLGALSATFSRDGSITQDYIDDLRNLANGAKTLEDLAEKYGLSEEDIKNHAE